MKLHVDNLVYNMTEADLCDLFSPFGKVEKAIIITDHYTRQSKGFGFVEMASSREAYKAMEELDGKIINDKVLHVNKSHPNRQRGYRF